MGVKLQGTREEGELPRRLPCGTFFNEVFKFASFSREISSERRERQASSKLMCRSSTNLGCRADKRRWRFRWGRDSRRPYGRRWQYLLQSSDTPPLMPQRIYRHERMNVAHLCVQNKRLVREKASGGGAGYHGFKISQNLVFVVTCLDFSNGIGRLYTSMSAAKLTAAEHSRWYHALYERAP